MADSRLAAGLRAPLTAGERAAAVIGYFGTVLKRTWRASVFSRLVTPVLFLVAMGIGVGSLVDATAGGIDGTPYLRYVVPGVLMSSVMQWAVTESTWPVMTLIKWNQVYSAMLAAPLRVADVLRGHWAMVSLGIAGAAAVFTIVSALFGAIPSWWSLLGIPYAVLLGLAFATPLFWVAARTDNEESFSTIFRLVVTPLALFSGTFFPVAQLPLWLQPIPWCTPLWHATELARAAFLGRPLPDLWLVHLGVLVAYAALGAWGARRALTRRLMS